MTNSTHPMKSDAGKLNHSDGIDGSRDVDQTIVDLDPENEF